MRNSLQEFSKPYYRVRAFKIFLDRSSLSANPGLWTMVTRALEASDYLLLLASPDAASSRWVAREIDWWLAHRSLETLLVVLTDGDIIWDEIAGDFDWSRTTALPSNLRGRLTQEPKYVDLRFARTDEALSLRHTRYREAVADLAATLHGRPRDELDGEDVRQHRKFRRVALVFCLALILFAITAGVAAVFAHWQAQEATWQAEEARRQTGIAETQRRQAVAQRVEAERQRGDAVYQTGLAVGNQGEAERQAHRANQQRDLALSREFAVRAMTQLQVDPASGISLARQAARLSESGEVEDALRQSLVTPVSVALTSPNARPPLSAVFTTDGSFVFATTRGDAQLWDARNGRPPALGPRVTRSAHGTEVPLRVGCRATLKAETIQAGEEHFDVEQILRNADLIAAQGNAP